jgi:RNA polymerase sigma factor (sigma-70 family)
MTEAAARLDRLRHAVRRAGLDALSDGELLRRFAAGHDADAFAILAERHGPMVLGLCRGLLRDYHAAEDAFQATFLVLARRARSVRRPDALAAWLHGTARRIARRARRANRPPAPPAADRPPCPDPLDEASARERLAILEAEFARLPEHYRLPLLLCAVEGRPVAEAAQLLGTSPGAVRGRLQRGRAVLRDRLTRRGITPTSLPAWPTTPLTPELRGAALRLAGGEAPPPAVAALAAGGLWPGLAYKLAALVVLAGLLGAGLLAAGAPPSPPPPAAPPAAPDPAVAEGKDPSTRRDLHGDPLPDGAVHRLGTVRFRQTFVAGVTCSTDGKLMASTQFIRLGTDPKWTYAAVWDAEGRELRRLPLVKTLVFSPDNTHAAVQEIVPKGREFELGQVKVVNVRTGEERLALHKANREPFAFTPDGSRLTVWNEDKRLRTYDAATGKVTRMTEPLGAVQALAYAPDGKRLYIFEGGRFVRVFDGETDKELIGTVLGEGEKQLSWDSGAQRTGPVLAVGGRYLAGSGSQVWVWDLAEGKEIARLPLTRTQEGVLPAFAVAVAPDGKTLAWADSWGGVTLADLATGKTRSLRPPMRWEMLGLAFTPDGKTLAAGGVHDDTLHLWDVASGEEKGDPAAHHGPVFAVAVSPDGKTIATAGRDATIRLWDRRTGAHLRTLTGHQGDVGGVRFTPDGKRLLSVGSDGTARLWDTATGLEIAELRQNEPGVPFGFLSSVGLSPDGRRAAAVFMVPAGERERKRAYELRVWDTATGKVLARADLGKHMFAPTAAFSPDGKTAALRSAGSGTHITLFGLATGKETGSLGPFEKDLIGLDYAPDGRLAVADYEGAIRIDDMKTRDLVSSLSVGPRLTDVAFSPDGLHLACVVYDRERGTTAVRLVEPAAGSTLWSAVLEKEVFGRSGLLAFTPDGRNLVTVGDGTSALVWDLSPPSWRRTPPGRLDAAGADRAWADLGADDPVKAYEATWRLAADPERAVPLLRERLATPPPPAARVRKLIADLGGQDFTVREAAGRELRQLGPRAEAALRGALKDKPDLETTRRIEELLADIARSPQTLRLTRAVSALELAGTDGARGLLEVLAKGPPEERLTREARAALGRMARMSGRD